MEPGGGEKCVQIKIGILPGKVQEHRKRLRKLGLRPIQIWVPDVRSKAFRAQSRRQSLLVPASPHARADQAFIDAGIPLELGMRRGDIWTVSGGKGYAGKPRPVAIVQDDPFDATDSVTFCAFTTDDTEAPLFRLAIEPTVLNGLRMTYRLMVDKITTVARSKAGAHVGRLDDVDLPWTRVLGS